MNSTFLSFGSVAGSLSHSLFGFLTGLANLMKPIFMMAISERDTSAAPGTMTIEDDAPGEFARIVTAVYFKTSLDVSAWDANDDTAWGVLIAAGDVIVLGPVTGMLPDPGLNTAKGYGFLDMRKKSWNYDIPFQHLNSDVNIDAYDRIADQPGDWSFMPVFEDLTAYLFLGKNLEPVPTLVNPRIVSETDEISDDRVMKVNNQFKTKRMPYALDVSGAAATFKKN